MRAAVEHGIPRVINTGPHFTVQGAPYEAWDYNIGPDVPPKPSTNLYATIQRAWAKKSAESLPRRAMSMYCVTYSTSSAITTTCQDPA